MVWSFVVVPVAGKVDCGTTRDWLNTACVVVPADVAAIAAPEAPGAVSRVSVPLAEPRRASARSSAFTLPVAVEVVLVGQRHGLAGGGEACGGP
jgi:hypothetical protein